MAVERQKEFVLDLSDVVKTRFDSFVNIRKSIIFKQEAEFMRRVADEDLSYEDQRDFRKKQLAREKEKAWANVEYIDELKTEVSNLDKLVRYEKIRTAYLDMYTDYKEGKVAIDRLVTFLENKLSEATDPETKKLFEEKLSEARIAKADSEMAVLDNRVTLAKNDKSVKLIDSVISDVNKKRNEALTIGDNEAVTALDIKIQTLKSEKQKIIVENKINDFDLQSFTQVTTASQKLNLLNNALSESDKTMPITIDNQRWDSEEDYWMAKRGAYLAGAGKGVFTSFFADYQGEVQDKINKVSSLNEWGFIPVSTISAIDSGYKSLSQKPELGVFQDLIENYRIDALDAMVSKTSDAIISEADTLGTWDEAETALTNLQAKFRIDMTAALGDLYKLKITTTPQKAGAIQATAQTIVESATGVEFDPDNPQHKKLYEVELQKLLTPPFEEVPTVAEEVIEEAKPPEELPVPAPEKEPEKAPYAGVQAVFGAGWKPSPIFEERGLVKKGVFGAVRIPESTTPWVVYTIGPGGKKIVDIPGGKTGAQQFEETFGTLEQKGIVGTISKEQAQRLGIKI